jgi:hypothetical protein
MAEKIVLAELTIDSDGVVSGVATATGSFDQGGQAMESLGKKSETTGGLLSVFTNRVFDLKKGMLGLARVLGITGLLIGIAVAIKRLTVEVISNTEWFKLLKEAVVDWWLALLKGESAVERLNRKLLAAGAGGISSTIEKLRELKKLQEEINRLQGATAQPAGFRAGLPGPFGIPTPTFTPATGKPSETFFKVLGIEAEQAQRKVNDLIRTMELFGLTQKEIADEFGLIFRDVGAAPEALDIFKTAGIPSPEDFDQIMGQIKATKNALEILAVVGRGAPVDLTGALANLRTEFEALNIPNVEEIFHELDVAIEGGGISTEQMAIAMDTLMKRAEAAGFTMEQLKEVFGEFVKNLDVEKLTAFEEGMLRLSESLSLGGAAVEAIQIGAAGAANVLAQALLEGGVSLREAITQILKDLARLFLTYGFLFLALGIAAKTPWGRFLDPTGGKHFFKASAIMFAGAAIAAAASAALGGRGEGGETATGNVPRGAPGDVGVTRTRPLIIINVEGFVGSEDELARKLSRSISFAQEDGAR